MRRSPKVVVLKDDGGGIYGVKLSADYCAEHECGIRELQDVFGTELSDRLDGIPSRTATRNFADKVFAYEIDVPARIPYGRRKKAALPPVACSVLGVSRYSDAVSRERVADDAQRLLPHEDRPQISGEWGREAFRLYAYDEGTREAVSVIGRGLASGDVALWLGGGVGNPFDRASLVVAVASLIPHHGAEFMLEADRDRNKLLDASAKTGIEGRLKEVTDAEQDRGRAFLLSFGHGQFALSPKWASKIDLKGRTTAHDVVYWLNPMDQTNYNAGWFTVEELDAWIAGTGPVVKTESEKRARNRG